MEEAKSTLRGSTVDTEYTDEAWELEWEKLKQNGIYEVNFGDFILYGQYNNNGQYRYISTASNEFQLKFCAAEVMFGLVKPWISLVELSWVL